MYYTVKYSDDMPEGFGGIARGPFITIRPKYEGDLGLLNHEIRHTEQFWRTFGFMPLFCWLSKKYKLSVEVEAYREQLKWAPATSNPDLYRAHYTKAISTKYGLDITEEEALKLLT